ncbi:MAG: hypothetical protein NC420_13605 [Eubacterium sp.]|nr:hypothetical protein [Eubacterium sp.]
MYDKVLHQAEYSQQYEIIKTKYFVKIIYHAMEAMRVYTCHKHIVPAHGIDPVIMHWNIRRAIPHVPDQITPIQPQYRNDDPRYEHPVKKILPDAPEQAQDSILQTFPKKMQYLAEQEMSSHSS